MKSKCCWLHTRTRNRNTPPQRSQHQLLRATERFASTPCHRRRRHRCFGRQRRQMFTFMLERMHNTRRRQQHILQTFHHVSLYIALCSTATHTFANTVFICTRAYAPAMCRTRITFGIQRRKYMKVHAGSGVYWWCLCVRSSCAL